MTAHNLCSATFVSRIDVHRTFREWVMPILGEPLGHFVDYRVDEPAQVVDASFAFAKARARYTPGYGCRLEYPETPAPPPPRPKGLRIPDRFAPKHVVASDDPRIRDAIERVFADDPAHPVKQVKAVVVVKDGRVIAERYARGIAIDTPLPSYSVAKSFTNALVGILVRQGRLAVDRPVGLAEWSAPNDPRKRITIEDLMRMQSGLDAREAESGFDPVSRMLYAEDDMARFAAGRPSKEPPATRFEYTSANTLIVDRLVGRIVGGGAKGLVDFAERELFAPLNLADVTLEFDGAGTFVGSSYVHASARDFARFGELYRNDGVAPDGRRVLPAGWVAWSRRATDGSSYGAGFFTNDGPSDLAAMRVDAGFPKDAFFASGFLGQRIYIVPSARLVVVRMGFSRGPTFGIADDLALVDTAIKATKR